MCNALNKVFADVEARLFGRNDKIKYQEDELKKEEEDLATMTNKISQEKLITIQWQ